MVQPQKYAVIPGRSPYAILGIPETANEKEIKDGYRRMAMKLHPDHNDSMDAVDEFREVQQAYELLRTPMGREFVRRAMMLGKSRSQNSAPGASGAAGAAASRSYFVNRSREKARQEREAVFGHRAEVTLSIFAVFMLAFHPFRVPFKTLLCIPIMYNANNQVIAIAGVQQSFWTSTLQVLGYSFAAAFCIEMMIAFASLIQRWRVRWIVNGFSSILFAISVLIWALDTIIARYTPLPYDLVNGLAFIGMGTALFTWLVFVYLFQKYSPTWEPIIVWVGMLTLFYLLIRLILPLVY